MAARKIVESERLILREAAVDDADFMFELLNEPSWRRFIGDHSVDSPQQATAYLIERYFPAYAQGIGFWVVELKSTGQPIGICGLARRSFLEDMDLGFALLEAYWKGGYGFESARAVLRYAGAVFQCPRLLAITKPGNENSVRLLERLGFVSSRQVTDPDTGRTLLVYALSPVQEMEQRP